LGTRPNPGQEQDPEKEANSIKHGFKANCPALNNPARLDILPLNLGQFVQFVGKMAVNDCESANFSPLHQSAQGLLNRKCKTEKHGKNYRH
jgi:hypothetical protein